jgi:predicted nucleic acid-binding protein
VLATVLIREDLSERAAALILLPDTVATASITYVEARAAVAAARRNRRLSSAAERHSRNELEDRWRELNVVELDDAIVRRAGDAAQRHRLRAHDAIHLASALALNDSELILASLDADVRRAALESGLRVAPA